jgi:hypothetical protein
MLLVLVACFAELGLTGLWAIWTEQHAVYTPFLARPTIQESTVQL